MELKPLYEITIGDLVEVSKIMKLPMRTAGPKMQAFCDKHELEWIPSGRNVCYLARKLLEGE